MFSVCYPDFALNVNAQIPFSWSCAYQLQSLTRPAPMQEDLMVCIKMSWQVYFRCFPCKSKYLLGIKQVYGTHKLCVMRSFCLATLCISFPCRFLHKYCTCQERTLTWCFIKVPQLRIIIFCLWILLSLCCIYTEHKVNCHVSFTRCTCTSNVNTPSHFQPLWFHKTRNTQLRDWPSPSGAVRWLLFPVLPEAEQWFYYLGARVSVRTVSSRLAPWVMFLLITQCFPVLLG